MIEDSIMEDNGLKELLNRLSKDKSEKGVSLFNDVLNRISNVNSGGNKTPSIDDILKMVPSAVNNPEYEGAYYGNTASGVREFTDNRKGYSPYQDESDASRNRDFYKDAKSLTDYQKKNPSHLQDIIDRKLKKQVNEPVDTEFSYDGDEHLKPAGIEHVKDYPLRYISSIRSQLDKEKENLRKSKLLTGEESPKDFDDLQFISQKSGRNYSGE